MKKNKKNILCIAPHPDDETLGCGGTLLKHKSQGDEINWLICTRMKNFDNLKWKDKTIKKRNNEIKKVIHKYHFKNTEILDLPAARLDTISMNEIVKKISFFLKKIKPEIIYLNHFNDVHSDHRIIFDAICTATKNFRNPFIKSLRMYEVLSETHIRKHNFKSQFVPQLYVDITKYMNKKKEILKIYKSEIKKFPFPRSLEAVVSLAKIRGSEVNVKFAEAFMILYEKN